MRKANNSKTNKQKSADRKIKKVSDFIDKSSSVYTVLYVFKENILKHKQAWESSIKNNDGYLQPYYKGLLTQIVNRCNEVLEYFKNNGFELKKKAIEEIEEIIKTQVIDEIKYEEIESEYTKNILTTAIVSLFCTMSFKKFHRNYNQIKGLEKKLQNIIDVCVAYFDFFERDIQELGFVK